MLSREEALNIDIGQLKRVHLIGITSGFNSFCANFLIERGLHVTASEIDQENEEARKWIERGVLYEGGHDARYISSDIDLVVYPNGPIPGNPECDAAQRMNIPAITIGQLTGLVSRSFKVIAVAGTHGKTTTSALIVWLFKNNLGTPNFIIGDRILDLNTSWNYDPSSEYLVIEACEYKRQFLDRAPTPYISVVTNIDLDHTDYYKDQNDYNSAFVEFLSNTTGSIVMDSSGKNESDVLSKLSNINFVDVKDIDINTSVENLYGSHNFENLSRAYGVAKALNISPNFSNFPGVASRFEYQGETLNGMKVFLDYAHNPKKIESCIQGAKSQFPEKRVVLVWQPHSFERSFSFKDDFAKAISNADMVYIPNIFSPKRESEEQRGMISEEEFVQYISNPNPDIDIQLTKSFENTALRLTESNFDDSWIAVLASAGDLKDILPMLNLVKK